MRRIMTVAVLAPLGFVAGVAVAELGPGSYTFTYQFNLPHSQNAIPLAALARSQHVQGIRVRVLDEHTFQITGHGTAAGAVSAADKVASKVRKAIDTMPDSRYWMVHGGVHALARPQRNAAQTGAIGFLAGLGVGLGIILPYRR